VRIAAPAVVLVGHFHVQFSRFPRHQGVTHWEGEISEGDMVPSCQVSRLQRPRLALGRWLITSSTRNCVGPYTSVCGLPMSRPKRAEPAAFLQFLFGSPATLSLPSTTLALPSHRLMQQCRSKKI